MIGLTEWRFGELPRRSGVYQVLLKTRKIEFAEYVATWPFEYWITCNQDLTPTTGNRLIYAYSSIVGWRGLSA